MFKMVSVYLLILIFFSQSSGTILEVPSQYEKITDAIEQSEPGDTVLVAPGLYIENLSFKGKDIVLSSHFILDSNYSFVYSTIIEGSNEIGIDTGSVVLFQGGETRSAELTGFTIRGGFGTQIGSTYLGGGILCRNGSDPTICYNIIKMNNTVEGGGCAFIDSDPHFCRNQIINNEAVRGGGLMLDNSSTEISHCIFANNIASGDAGGILMITANQPSIKSSVFYKNRGMSIGSIDCSNSMADITHNCFFGTEGINFNECQAGLGDVVTINFNLDSSDIYSNLFVNPEFINPEGNNFELNACSKLVDAGFDMNPNFPMNGIYEDIGIFEVSYQVGDVYRDLRIDISDIVKMINYIFRSDEISCPIFRADLNCDRIVSVADAVYFINYIFSGGPGFCEGFTP